MRLGKSRLGGERNMSRLNLAQSSSRTSPAQGELCSPHRHLQFCNIPTLFLAGLSLSPFPCSGGPGPFSSSQYPSSFLTACFISVAHLQKGTEMGFFFSPSRKFWFKVLLFPSTHYNPTPNEKSPFPGPFCTLGLP